MAEVEMMTGVISLIKPALCVCGVAFLVDSAFANPIDWANGEWEIDRNSIDPETLSFYGDVGNCAKTPIIISINNQTNRYNVIYTGAEHLNAQADILEKSPHFLSIQYDDEGDFFEDGSKYVWHLVFDGPDRFRWAAAPQFIPGERVQVFHSLKRCDLGAV